MGLLSTPTPEIAMPETAPVAPVAAPAPAPAEDVAALKAKIAELRTDLSTLQKVGDEMAAQIPKSVRAKWEKARGR